MRREYKNNIDSNNQERWIIFHLADALTYLIFDIYIEFLFKARLHLPFAWRKNSKHLIDVNCIVTFLLFILLPVL